MATNYYEIEAFSNFYFEDSYLLNLEEKNDLIEFLVLAVLTENHPRWQQIKADERYCYCNISIKFPHVVKRIWKSKKFDPIMDPDGSIDFGNIDFFTFAHGKYNLGGSWGEVTIYSDMPTVEILDD